MTAPRRAYESAETKKQTNQQFTGTAADRPDKLFKALNPAEPDFTEALECLAGILLGVFTGEKWANKPLATDCCQTGRVHSAGGTCGSAEWTRCTHNVSPALPRGHSQQKSAGFIGQIHQTGCWALQRLSGKTPASAGLLPTTCSTQR